VIHLGRKTIVNGVLGAAAIAAGVTGYSSIGSSPAASTVAATSSVTMGSVLASVSATGNASAASTVGVDFSTSGTLTELDVKAGDHVTKGQVLARVDGATQQQSLSSAQANLRSAQANPRSAQAKLSELRSGETGPQRDKDAIALQQSQNSVDQAQAILDDTAATVAQNKVSYQSAIDKATIASTNAQNDATQNSIGYDLRVAQAQNTLNAAQSQRTRDANAVGTASNNLSNAQSAYQSDCDKGDATACQKISSAQDALTQAQTTLARDDDGLVADQLAITSAAHDRTAGLLKDAQAITSAQQGITDATNAQTAGLLKDAQSVRSSQRSLATAQLNVGSTMASNAINAAPATASALASAEAAVATAQSTVATAQSTVADARKAVAATTLTSPADGTVASVAKGIGETVGSGSGSSSAASSSSSSSSSSASGFIVLTDLRTMQVATGFSESDAAKVKVGQPANVTFDAIPGQQAAGTVVAVDTTSTVVSNVVTYKVTVLLDQAIAGLKPGMTATVQVIVAQADGVLQVPSAAITKRGTSATVTLVDAKGVRTPKVVTTGVEGDDATEITSGLKVGDKVVTSTATPALTGTTRTGGFPGGGAGGAGGGATRIGRGLGG
jgi:multidrug efflux pump subunit AcrA (membrane-fusion protein)